MHTTDFQTSSRTIRHDNPTACPKLDFLWLELTNRCNLQCVHCYTDSHPHAGDRDILTRDDYESIMLQAYTLGCRKIQFIGGEPQLNSDLMTLLMKAKLIGFEFIEVYSNLTRLDEETLRYASDNGICFATSVYSDEPDAHDAVTKVKSSHARTIANIERLVEKGVETRAAIIVIDQDRDAVGRTTDFLRRLGVKRVGHGETREFGRGEAILGQSAKLSGLCGHCWAGKLCVAPDGAAFPCVMARQWPVGNVLAAPLADIVRGQALKQMRQEIFDDVWLPKAAAYRAHMSQLHAAPDCQPASDEKQDDPYEEKSPGDITPASECFPCPQSCTPDFETPPCAPAPCPQSCDPFPTGNPPETVEE